MLAKYRWAKINGGDNNGEGQPGIKIQLVEHACSGIQGKVVETKPQVKHTDKAEQHGKEKRTPCKQLTILLSPQKNVLRDMGNDD